MRSVLQVQSNAVPGIVLPRPRESHPGVNVRRMDKIHEAGEGQYLGPCCFGPVIRTATYPKGFQIDKNIKPYDGTAKPATWLQDYGNAVAIAGGNPNIAVK